MGGRYATVLGVVPDLLAGTCDQRELLQADSQVLELLRRFSPEIRRRSEHVQNGLYLLDAGGLSQAFKGMTCWARGLVGALAQAGWEGRLAVGFTAFATEMATYQLSFQRPIRLYQSLRQEEKCTLDTPLTAFSLSPEQIGRLRRFEIFTLGDFLELEPEEVKRRFGGDLLEFYHKASGAIFCSFPPLPEPEPMLADFGFAQSVGELEPLLQATRRLLSELLPRLLKLEQAVTVLHLQFLTEDNKCHRQSLRPTMPTADLHWLMKLVRLRLERYFQKHPLRWGSRVDRVVVQVEGEADPEKQGDLFSDWALDVSIDGEEHLAPRDKQAGLWALSQVRAEFGDACLVQAHLVDHHLPGRDHLWTSCATGVSPCGRQRTGFYARPPRPGKSASPSEPPAGPRRVRRIVYQSVGVSRRAEWSDLYGPYAASGGWWGGGEGYVREYYFAQKERQTAWIYEDLQSGRWLVQGWLQ